MSKIGVIMGNIHLEKLERNEGKLATKNTLRILRK